MAYRRVRDKARILATMQRCVPLNIYQIGDLDDFFWSHTEWFEGEEDSVALLYRGMEVPCLLAFELADDGAMASLLDELRFHLPDSIYAHVSPHLASILQHGYERTSKELHKKMALTEIHSLAEIDTSPCVRLGPKHLDEISRFYEGAYPGNWFDPRMLETGQYVGAWCDGQLASVAGVHVYSSAYRVAALGNIATAPRSRRRGFARACTAALCAQLLETVDCIGLNVHEANHAAIACYEGLGFRFVADYCELALAR